MKKAEGICSVIGSLVGAIGTGVGFGVLKTLVNCLRKTLENPHFMGFFFFLFR